MPWQQKIGYSIGPPMGGSFMDSAGTSWILCGVSDGRLFVIECLYQRQFALKQYEIYTLQDINEFPANKKDNEPSICGSLSNYDFHWFFM